MTEHMNDYLSLIQEMIAIKNEQLWHLTMEKGVGLKMYREQLKEQIAILEEKKIEVESFIKSGPKNHGKETQ